MSAEPRPTPPTDQFASYRVRFAEFEADLRARELFRDGERVPLQGRPFEVLTALLERPGEVILRQELQDRLWPGQIVEFDNNLNTALTKLRRALDDTAEEPTVIETLPKRGYRLLVPVEPVHQPSASMPTSEGGRPRGGRWLTRVLTVAVVVMLSIFVAGRLRQDGASTPVPRSTDPAPGTPVRTSLLVVLPFATLDESAASERLADTLTEELINRLAELLPTELGVIARTSAMRFKGSAADLAEVREELGVDYVLEGSVSRDAAGMQIRARFVLARDQAHLWAESYEAGIEEMPRVQRSMAERIATAVSVQLRSSGALTTERPVAPEAWEAYLQARFLLTGSLSPSGEETAEAVAHLQRSVEIAPDFALAWAALADAVSLQPGPAAERHERAREAAARAIDLAPGLSRPHHRLASLALYQNWDWAEAEREFEWAISLAPNLAVNHHSRAAWYSTQGRHEEALESIGRALELDPLSVVLHADSGWYLFVARRYEEAVERCRQAIELVPGHRGANSYLFHSLMALGRVEEAGQVARALLEIEEAGPAILERASRSSEAAIDELRRYRLSVLEAAYGRGVASPSRLALAHLALGNRDEALGFLEEGLERRWGWVYPFLAVYPLLDPLADEPRLQRMVETVGIP
jgi:TolB-like protein/DNA-binding winged helix-turn-helix (wHTH) protein